MTCTITPTDAANKLRIDVVMMIGNNTANWLTAALFQDSTANALAAISHHNPTGGGGNNIVFSHFMTAGTTSATTFKVRAGCNVSSTTVFNGNSGARWFGGVAASSITITEIIP
jgi:hypothetical protein